jgi:nucleoside-diphosphate-sugar epimerase
VSVDLRTLDLTAVPDDFSHVFYAAAAIATREWDEAVRVNALAAGSLMDRCRTARGFVYVSSGSVYKNAGARLLREDDPLVDHAFPLPVYTATKIAGECVVRAASERLATPALIARLFSFYGPAAGAPAARLRLMLRGEPVPLSNGSNLVTPLFEDDLIGLGTRALNRAAIPAPTVNLAGSEAVDAEEYCRYMAEIGGVETRFSRDDDQLPQLAAEPSLMHDLLGQARVGWREGMRRVVEAAARTS